MESGKLVNKVGFEIDSKSWKNLDKFQKRLTDMKKQMKGLSTSVNVRATVNQFKQVSDGIEKVRRQTQKKTHGIGMEFGLAGGRDKTYAFWWEDQLKAKEKATRESERREKARKPYKTPTEQALGMKFTTGKDKTYASWWEDQLKAKEKATRGYRARDRKQAAMDDRIANARTRGMGSLGRASVPFNTRQQWSSDFNKLEQSYRKGEISATRFNAKVSELNKNLLHQSKAAKTSGSSMNQLRRQMINLTAAYSAGSALSNVFNTGKTLQSMEAGIKVFAKDETGIRENMKFIADESERLGMNFMVAAENYTKFAIVTRSKMSIGESRNLFSSISEYATVLQVDQHKFNRAMVAINQMASKGQIMQEELKGQLSESLGGSTQIFAKAAGMTEGELMKAMKKGKIKATPEFFKAVAKEYASAAREGGALSAAQIKVNSEYQRFLNGLTMIKDEIFKGGFGEGMAMIFKQSALMMKEMKPLATFLGSTLKVALGTVTSALKILEVPLGIIRGILGALPRELAGTLGFIGAITLGVLRFNAAMVLLGKSTITVASILRTLPPVAAALVAEDVYTTLQSRDNDTALNRLAKTRDMSGNQLIGKFIQAPLRTTIEFVWKDGADTYIEAKVQDNIKQDIAAETQR